MRLYTHTHTHTHTHTSVLTNSLFKGSPFHSGNGCNRGISLIALIITIIVIIILAAISIAGVSGVVERSRYAKFCGDLDAVQDAVSQAYGTKRIKEAQNPDGLKTSEEIYKWVATGEDNKEPATAEGPDNRELYKLADESVLGLDLPKYGNSDWGVDPKTGEVFLVEGFEYDNHIYYSKADVQNGGREKEETGGGETTPPAVYAKLYNDGTLILSNEEDYTASGYDGVQVNYGTDIWYNITINEPSMPPIENEKVPRWIYVDEYGYPQNKAKEVIIHGKIQPTDTSYWFYNFKGTELNLTNLDTSFVTDMNSMFYECMSLTTLEGISGWNTENVKDMSFMFDYCTNLTEISGISNWNTGNVKDMKVMFQHCEDLATLDLSGWNTSKVTEMQYMFFGCYNLETLDLSGWDIAENTNIESMFTWCDLLSTVYVKDENMKSTLLKLENDTDISESQIKIKDEETADDDVA